VCLVAAVANNRPRRDQVIRKWPRLDPPHARSLAVGNDLSVVDNDSLALIDGLYGISTVGNDLFIQQNNCLSPADAGGFGAGVAVSGTTTIENNGASYPCD
jgi:hypothetical protein